MDSLNTRRIKYFSLVLTLIIILNYLSNTKFKRFSLNKNFIKQNSRIEKNAAFELQNTTPRSKKQRESRHRKNSPIHRRKRSNRTRSYYHSKVEIELNKTLKIQLKQCNSIETGISIFIPIRANGFAKRELLRSTCVQYAKQKGVCVYFLIALDPSNEIQEKNLIEAKEHQDIIQSNFIDDYYNLTLKSISLLRWANIHCKQDQFVIKVYDEIIYKIDWFIKNRQKFTKGMRLLTKYYLKFPGY